MDICVWLWGDIVPHVNDSKLFALTTQCKDIDYLIRPFMITRFSPYQKYFQQFVQSRDLDALKWLTSYFGLTVEDARLNNNKALRWAARNGHLDMCQWLATHFQLTTKDAQSSENYALRWAARCGHLGMCQWLVSYFGLTAEDARSCDNFALRWAAKNNHLGMCKWLATHFQLTTKDARSCDNFAIRFAQKRVLRKWLKTHFDLDFEDTDDVWDRLMFCASLSSRSFLVKTPSYNICTRHI